jgi:peptidoglycan/xylan/chitin deacetylase (PgdA/CDA1 family)
MRRCLLVAVAGLVVLACRVAWAQGTEPVQESPVQADTLRAVAVTIDDLPGVVPGGLSALTRVTHHLLDHLTANAIPAIGFVNEAKLEQPGEKDARIALLQQWVEAGLELGNHSYAHRSFHATPFDTFTADVLRGEVVTRRLLAERSLVPRYFRHPYLHTAQDRATKEAFVRELSGH